MVSRFESTSDSSKIIQENRCLFVESVEVIAVILQREEVIKFVSPARRYSMWEAWAKWNGQAAATDELRASLLDRKAKLSTQQQKTKHKRGERTKSDCLNAAYRSNSCSLSLQSSLFRYPLAGSRGHLFHFGLTCWRVFRHSNHSHISCKSAMSRAPSIANLTKVPISQEWRRC